MEEKTPLILNQSQPILALKSEDELRALGEVLRRADFSLFPEATKKFVALNLKRLANQLRIKGDNNQVCQYLEELTESFL